MEAQLWVVKQERFEAKAVGASDDQVKEFDRRILMLEEEIRNVAASAKGLLLSSSNGKSDRPAISEREDVRQLYGPSAQHRFDDEKESANDNPSL